MSLNVILGKPKTGKSSYLYGKIEEDIKNKKEVILFVPSQQRQETENNYMNVLKKDGIIGVNITTISEYVKENIINLGLYNDEKYISKEDKKIILADVILKSSDKLKVFKSVSKKEGFLELIYIYIDLLRKSGFNRNMLESFNITNGFTYTKLKEISNIYELYLKEIEDKFLDSIDEVNIFLNNVECLDFSNTSIYFDSYNNFTESEFKIINLMLKKVDSVTIAISTDISCVEDIYSTNSNDMFEVPNLTYKRLLSMANSCGISVQNKLMYIKHIKQREDLKYLSNNIFEDTKVDKMKASNIFINLYSNYFYEIQHVANVINKKIREGYRYKDIDIYTTDIDKYKDIVTRVFFDTKIPVYINSEENIKFSKLTRYILKLLDILQNGIKKDTLLDILKIGFSDVESYDIYEFENYLLEFNINDYYITKPFKINNKKSNEHIYDLDNLNKIREKLLKVYDIKIKKEAKATWYISYIYEHLQNNNIFEKYNNALVSIKENSNEFDISNIDKEKQVWDKICEIFNSISKVYKNEILFDKFVHVFNLQIKDTKIKVAPPVIDSVNLLDINLSKMKESKIAFFIGVNEGNFPNIVEEDIIFKDEELNSLKENNINLKETTVSKQNMANYNIYQTLNSITDSLYITIPTSDYSGKPLRVSRFVEDIKKVLDIKIEKNICQENNKIDDIYSKNEMLEYMLECIKKSSNQEEIISIYDYINKDIIYNRLLEYKKNDDNLKSETLKIIYTDKLSTSISKLELFKKCPFSYYMKYILRIEPRKEFEISSLDIGSFMHEVLEKFSKYLFKNNISWQALLTYNLWECELYKIIEERLDESLGNKKQSIKYGILKEKLINTMKRVVIVIANGFNQSEFVPYGYEIEFKDGKIFAPIKIQIDENNTMNIVGKIDRVDILNLEDKVYVRIVDYKSSKKDLKLEDIKEGISLQLITYLSSFIENMGKKEKNTNKILPAGMLYFNLSDKLVNLKDYINDEEKIKNETIKALRMKGIFLKDVKVIEKMDSKLATDKRLIDISKSTLNKENTNRALNEEDYNKLFCETKKILGKIGKEIVEGVVRIRPNKKVKHCEYCNYSSVCRKNSIL